MTVSRKIPHAERTRHMTSEEKAQVRAMFMRGLSINNIHRETGWSHATLKRYQPTQIKRIRRIEEMMK